MIMICSHGSGHWRVRKSHQATGRICRGFQVARIRPDESHHRADGQRFVCGSRVAQRMDTLLGAGQAFPHKLLSGLGEFMR